VLEQSALALTIGMGGAVVLLLAGTQFLEWYWVVLLALASLGVGVYRLRRTIPSTYKLAQRIDRRLSLADALSTATYFESDPSRGHAAIRERQRAEAESVARTVDLHTALPFKKPRYGVPALVLAAVAVGVFALRFAVTGSLSLQPSLVKIAFDTFFPPHDQMAKLDKKRDPFKPPSTDENNPDSPTVENPDTPDQTLDANDAPDASDPQTGDNSKESAQKGRQDEQNADVQGDQSEKGDKQSNGNDASEDNAKQQNKDGKQQNAKDGKQQNAKDGKQGSENQNSSLMDKLKDAMANMMNKMKSSSKDGQQSQQQQQNAQNGQQGQKDKSSQQGKQGQQQQAQSDAQSDQQSDAGDKKQTADAKGSEKSSDKNASQDSKSGIGSADGDKAAKEAEQLAAMGKISEILGKRAQNVTGEVMVEVGSSKQQLKTPWAQKQASHAEAGGEINRDEVPLMYQQFVQQYFEEIRKTPKPAKTSTKDPG